MNSHSKILEAGVLSAQSVFIHGIQLSTTEIPPGSIEVPPPAPPAPEKIVWIIILTLLLFAMGVAGIVEIQRRCLERQAMLDQVPNDPSKPPTVASLCCPCIAFEASECAADSALPVRKYHHKEYLKAQCDDDDSSSFDDPDLSMEMTGIRKSSSGSGSNKDSRRSGDGQLPRQSSSGRIISSDSPPRPHTPPSSRPSPPPLPPPHR
jgi:hypothetical protein